MKGVTPLRCVNAKVSRKRRPNMIRTLSLIICFPLGLYVLWTRSCCPRSLKTLISAAAALVLIAILTPMTNPPEREIGGIRLVGAEPEVDVFGPEAPADREIVEIYAPRRTAILVEATATPVPVVVYCNNGGKYYHSEECVYVKDDTPSVTLTRALEAGYTQCTSCNAPDAVY